jgi:DNA mismatch repair protein MutS
LRNAIVNPLQDISEIEKRQNIIEEFLLDKILLDKVTEKLKMVADLDNILTRLSLNRANPRDLLNLKKSLETILEIYELIKIN